MFTLGSEDPDPLLKKYLDLTSSDKKLDVNFGLTQCEFISEFVDEFYVKNA